MTINDDSGPGFLAGPARIMEEQVRGSNVTPFAFPLTVAFAMFGGWVLFMSFETCILQRVDPKFDCWSSIQFFGIFSLIGATLTGLMALLARVLLYPFLPFYTSKPEWSSALLASALLMLVTYSVFLWDLKLGNIGILLFGWLGLSFVVCGISLILVKYLSRDHRV